MANKQYPFLSLAAVNAPLMDEIARAVERVVRSGRYVGGPEVDAFESALADYTGTRYAVGCANGLDALRLIFRAYLELDRLRPGQHLHRLHLGGDRLRPHPGAGRTGCAHAQP